LIVRFGNLNRSAAARDWLPGARFAAQAAPRQNFVAWLIGAYGKNGLKRGTLKRERVIHGIEI